MRQAAVLKNIFAWQLFEAYKLESLLLICYLFDLWKFFARHGLPHPNFLRELWKRCSGYNLSGGYSCPISSAWPRDRKLAANFCKTDVRDAIFLGQSLHRGRPYFFVKRIPIPEFVRLIRLQLSDLHCFDYSFIPKPDMCIFIGCESKSCSIVSREAVL
jgi:hypothetical protein